MYEEFIKTNESNHQTTTRSMLSFISGRNEKANDLNKENLFNNFCNSCGQKVKQ